MRSLPNIIVTGTPGVGKTTTCEQLVSQSSTTRNPFTHLSINDLVKSRSCHESYDEDLKTHIVDEDKLLDEVEKDIGDGEKGGFLIDWHACDLFPERWVDLVVVLRCEDTSVLFDRLHGRGYGEQKLQENMDAEIFGVLSDEAKEGFAEGTVVELKSVTADDVDENCDRIMVWVDGWMQRRQAENVSRT